METIEKMENKTTITVEATIAVAIEKVWKCWTEPQLITQWNNASDDWHTPHAENDLREGGRFTSRMEAKDASFGFDFGGTYTLVETNKQIEYTLDDDRKVTVRFTRLGNETTVVETFEAENMNSIELQKDGWQAILNNFKKYVESN